MSLDLPANINMTLDARHFCVMLYIGNNSAVLRTGPLIKYAKQDIYW